MILPDGRTDERTTGLRELDLGELLYIKLVTDAIFGIISCLKKTTESPRGNLLHEARGKMRRSSADWIPGDGQKLTEQGDRTFVPNQTK